MTAPFDMAVRGGLVASPTGCAPLDIYVRDGRIAAVSPRGRELDAATVLDASGRLVLPGGVDTHVHFMEPGDPEREDFLTGSAAAAARGVTTVVEHTHGWPVTDAARLREKVSHLEGRSHVDFGLAAHVWPDKVGELESLWRDGVTYFKAFTCATHGVPAIDNDALLRIGQRLAEIGAPCLVHCEDDVLTAHAERRLRSSGRSDGSIIPSWRSREAELLSVTTVSEIARWTGARFVIAHASSPEVLDVIAREHAAGSPVVAESCPQYLHLREAEVLTHGAFRKFTPPARLRSDHDEQRMWAAFDGGLIHHISSDHAPATRAQKQAGDLWSVHFGLPGIDTTFPLMLHAALTGRTSLERVVDAYCEAPARLYGLRGKGRLAVGYDGDLALVDPDAEVEITDDDVISKAGWSPYAGRRLRGRVTATVVRGNVIARDGAPVCAPSGRFLPGPGAR
jgi:dihydroorotase